MTPSNPLPSFWMSPWGLSICCKSGPRDLPPAPHATKLAVAVGPQLLCLLGAHGSPPWTRLWQALPPTASNRQQQVAQSPAMWAPGTTVTGDGATKLTTAGRRVAPQNTQTLAHREGSSHRTWPGVHTHSPHIRTCTHALHTCTLGHMHICCHKMRHHAPGGQGTCIGAGVPQAGTRCEEYRPSSRLWPAAPLS